LTFLNPAGLLLLLGIPLLILLFLIKPKYRPVTVPGTIIWRMCRKLMQAHHLSESLIRYLILLLQLLTVAVCALIAAQPRLSIQRQNSEIIVILDTSVSMLQTDDSGVSRFDAAREAITAQLGQLGVNPHITLLTTDTETNLLIERTGDTR